MSLEHGLELHVGDDVAAHENEIRADNLQVVDFPEGVARAEAPRRGDRANDHIGRLRPSRLAAKQSN